MVGRWQLGRGVALRACSLLFCATRATGGWTQVAFVGPQPCVATGTMGDTSSFATANSKLSDDDINALGFDIVKFEPVNADTGHPTTFFDFSGLEWGANTPRHTLPYALTEEDALAGKFVSDPCAEYRICNFGRAHCPNTVKAAWGWKESGGCGNAPAVGSAGVELGAARVYVHARSRWGWPFLLACALAAAAYLGVGLHLGRAKTGGKLSVAAHPHYPRWQELRLLVQDGVAHSRARWEARMRGAGYAPVVEPAGGGSARGESEGRGKARPKRSPDEEEEPSDAAGGGGLEEERLAPKPPRDGAARAGLEEQRRTAAGLHESQAKIAVVGLADG